jgi:hypothetical protein
VHPPALRQAAYVLIAAGVNDCEIARRLGLPRTTVRDMRRRDRPDLRTTCPRCWRATSPVRFTAADYAELLGLYLGDGHIAELSRTQRLRLSLDSRHEEVVADADALLRRCFPANRVGRVIGPRGTMVVLHVYHRHLSCLFPQHGSGKKHDRPILLEAWQRGLVDAAPWSLLRGLIRSDGSVYLNRTGRYVYLSYDFHNRSRDILDLFVDVCQALDLRPRVYARHARLYRRADVAQLVEHDVTKR